MKNRKTDATGRSRGTYTRVIAANLKPPGQFVWLTAELLESPAWCGLSANGRRLIDRLMIEHLSHGGIENGRLPVTHKDLEEYGLSRNCIRYAIDEAEAFGLIRFKRGGRWGGANRPSVYRLTWLGNADAGPTNEWKVTTQETVNAWKRHQSVANKGRKKQFPTRKTASAVPPELRVVGGISESAGK